MRTVAVLIAACAALGVAGAAQAQMGAGPRSTFAGDPPESARTPHLPPIGVRPHVTVPLPSMTYGVLKAGPAVGRSPTRADTITVRYRGWLQNGKVFNTSADDGEGTTTFELGKLIPGWIAALQMMKPGDVWQLTIPPYLAYGHAGKPAHDIPPDATLTFDVELVSVTPAPPKDPTG